ncbi:Fic family protein [Holdemanella biformis]|uniref:Fic family protein n=1 Tax=Holdemanella biformis TaxID=1735 RepID=UPI00265EC422|nr:Fic family protein [Holdemanella biformis]
MTKIKNELISHTDLYVWTQINFAYHSNKIEGSHLSKNQTKQIFEANDLTMDLDDALEARNHFRLFDYMLKTVDEPLSKEMMIQMNMILKRGTSYEDNPVYNVGGFKVRENGIGLINPFKTTKPADVETEIDVLLEKFQNKGILSFEDIVEFHVCFERIHPFGDGNGRTGRMIMFKQCLQNSHIPFVLLDRDRAFYLRGLKEWDFERNYLIDTLLTQQDIYASVCEQFDIFKDFGQKELSKNKIVDENEQYVLFEIDEGMYQLVADDQVIGETEKNTIKDALESIKSQKVKLDF